MRSITLPITMAVLACAVATAGQSVTSEAARRITGGVTSYVAAKDDTLRSIGARFGIDAATLAADNDLQPGAKLTAGQPLRVDNRHIVPDAAGEGGITINVPQRMLFFEWEGAVAGLPVAVGQATWQTPTRPFTIVRTETDPTWDVPESIREEARRAGRYLPASVPPGPSNPLGKYWLGLSIPSVGIHGTNAPTSIYRATTHGCIRVGPDDIAWLFPRVTAGTPGRIVYEPIMLAEVDGQILLEVHGDVYRRLKDHPRAVVRALAQVLGLSGDIDWDRADDVIAARHGVARTVAGPSRAAPGVMVR